MKLTKGVVIGSVIGVTVITVTTVILVGRARHKKMFDAINAQLDNGAPTTGTSADIVNLNAFNPNYFRTVAGFNEQAYVPVASRTATAIYNDVRPFLPNNQDDIMSQLTLLNSAAKVSLVAYSFEFTYKRPFSTFLLTALSGDNLTTLYNTIKQFPPK